MKGTKLSGWCIAERLSALLDRKELKVRTRKGRGAGRKQKKESLRKVFSGFSLDFVDAMRIEMVFC